MKTEKVHGPSEVSLESIVARGGVEIQGMAEISQRDLHGFRMLDELTLNIVVPIFKGKGDVRNCSCYRAVKLLEHGMMVVRRELEKRLRRIVSVDEIQFGFMPERGTIDAVFILRRIQTEYHANEKTLYMHFVDIEKAFHRVLRKAFKWVMKKNGVPRVLVASVISLH